MTSGIQNKIKGAQLRSCLNGFIDIMKPHLTAVLGFEPKITYTDTWPALFSKKPAIIIESQTSATEGALRLGSLVITRTGAGSSVVARDHRTDQNWRDRIGLSSGANSVIVVSSLNLANLERVAQTSATDMRSLLESIRKDSGDVLPPLGI